MKMMAVPSSEKLNKDIDGGWAWVVLIGCMYLGSFFATLVLIFGLQIGPLTKKLDLSEAAISTIFNTFNFFFYLMLFISGPLSEQFGFRKVCMISSLITAIGYCSMTVASSTAYMICVFSIVIGSSSGIANYTTFSIIPCYFEKRIGSANAAFAFSTAATSVFISQLVRYLMDEFGYVGSVMIYSGILLNGCVASALFRPAPKRAPVAGETQNENLLQRKKTSEIEDSKKGFIAAISKKLKESMKALSSYTVLVNGISICLFYIGYNNFLMLIPYTMVEQGYSYQSAAWTLSCLSMANTFSRACMTCIADKKWFNIRIAYMISCAVAGTSCGLFPLISDQRWFFGTAIFYGLGLGVTVSLWVTLLIETVGIDAYGPALSACGPIMASGYIIAGPVLGVLAESSGSYSAGIYVSGVLQAMPTLIWCLLPLAKRLDARKKLKSHKDVENELKTSSE